MLIVIEVEFSGVEGRTAGEQSVGPLLAVETSIPSAVSTILATAVIRGDRLGRSVGVVSVVDINISQGHLVPYVPWEPMIPVSSTLKAALTDGQRKRKDIIDVTTTPLQDKDG
jgi:hypothetical protein